MADDSFIPETTHFGFTRIGQGEPFSKNGYAFSDSDRVRFDQILYALATHVHDGSPALGDPTAPPALVANATGGQLPASTTFYYRVSFMDEHGMESAASPEASVTTPDPIDPPTSPSSAVEATAGSLSPGIYSYLITFLDTYGGETTPSAMATAQITGAGTNRVRLDLPDLPTGVVSINVYRARPGQAQFYLLGGTATTTFYDDGSVTEDQTIVAPAVNTTNATNSVDVTIPGGTVPLGCVSWRIYQATISGGYDGVSLVHEVTEGATDVTTTPLTVWTDTGDALQPGFPSNTSACMPHGSLLTLNELDGTLPLAAMARGSQTLTGYVSTVTTSTVLMTECPQNVQPVKLTAFFQTAPTEAGVTTTVTVTDSQSNSVALQCGPDHLKSGDPAGYFHTSWPLIGAAQVEAEAGTFSDASVLIDNDPAAPSGEAVTLSTANQWVQVPMGTPEPGTYDTFATLRALTFGTADTGSQDVHIQVVNSSGTVLAETSYNLTQHVPIANSDYLYQELTGPTVTADGATAMFIRVRKTSTTDTTSYDVDSMRWSAEIPTLTAGPLTIAVAVTGGTTAAANANIALWF